MIRVTLPLFNADPTPDVVCLKPETLGDHLRCWRLWFAGSGEWRTHQFFYWVRMLMLWEVVEAEKKV